MSTLTQSTTLGRLCLLAAAVFTLVLGVTFPANPASTVPAGVIFVVIVTFGTLFLLRFPMRLAARRSVGFIRGWLQVFYVDTTAVWAVVAPGALRGVMTDMVEHRSGTPVLLFPSHGVRLSPLPFVPNLAVPFAGGSRPQYAIVHPAIVARRCSRRQGAR